LQASTASVDGWLIQPTYTLEAGIGGGYLYTYIYYKAFSLEDGMFMTSGDTDIRGRTVALSMLSLPVTLLSYEATLLSNKKVKLDWSTSSETNNHHFEIEKSTDGINFTSIGRIDATGNGNAVARYSFTDAETISRNTFYRLKQMDIDGNSKYLGTKLISVGSNHTPATVYPNPAQGNTITLVAGDQPLPLAWRISDVQGRVIRKGTMRQSQEEINITDINNGIYFLQIGEQVIKMKK
jgi:hypothetical protein